MLLRFLPFLKEGVFHLVTVQSYRPLIIVNSVVIKNEHVSRVFKTYLIFSSFSGLSVAVCYIESSYFVSFIN